MRCRLMVIASLLFVIACSKVEVESESLPTLSGLSPENMATNLPVFNVKANDFLFDFMVLFHEEDVFINGRLSGLDKNKQEIFSDKRTVIQIKGRSSSFHPLKSLGLRFEQPLGNEAYKLIQPGKILPNHRLKSFDALRFRNSGNDFGQTMLKDISYTQLAVHADLDVEVMYYQPCHLFVNDSYYGLANLRTENDIYGMTGLNEADTSEISLMKVDVDNGNLEWDEGNTAMAEIFIKALEEEDATTLWSIVDESSFLDYIIFQDYIGNFDWPHNNTRMYSLRGAPFRFILYDLDFAAYNNKNPILPEMEYRSNDLSKLYREMRKKPGFDNRLKKRQEEIYKKLTPAEFDRIVEHNSRVIEDEIPYLIALYSKPSSMLQWHRNLDLLRREFKMRDKSIRDKYGL